MSLNTETRQINIKLLKKNNLLKLKDVEFTIDWNDNNKVLIRINLLNKNNSHMKIKYTATEKGSLPINIDRKIKMEPVPCNFGGSRWYFICNCGRNNIICNKRCSILFQDRTKFCCRDCAKITYKSSEDNNKIKKSLYRDMYYSFKSYRYLLDEVKTRYYNGKPTRKFRNYLKTLSKINGGGTTPKM